MSRISEYRAALRGLAAADTAGPRGGLGCVDDWLPYLSAHSGLPGPRGNLELVAACAEEADVPVAEDLIATGDEFATMCGAVALGRHLGSGDRTHLDVLHRLAGDDRWRVRGGCRDGACSAPVTTTWEPASRWPNGGPVTPIRWSAVPRWRPSANRGCSRDPVFARRALTMLGAITTAWR